jgi:hypothetical protein
MRSSTSEPTTPMRVTSANESPVLVLAADSTSWTQHMPQREVSTGEGYETAESIMRSAVRARRAGSTG